MGPFLIYIGGRKNNLPNFFRAGLIVSGALTIAYNGKNYLAESRAGTGNSLMPGSGTGSATYQASAPLPFDPENIFGQEVYPI